MFLAWNEIKHSKLKYVLVIGVLFLIAYLVFFLTGLAYGLAQSNRTAVDKWDADAIILAEDANNVLSMSMFDSDDMNDITTQDKASLKQMNAVTQKANDSSAEKVNVNIFGIQPDDFLMPNVTQGQAFANKNEVIADESLQKEYGYEVGDKINVSNSDETLIISGFTDKAELSVGPVLYVNSDDFTKIRTTTGMNMKEEQINAVVVKAQNHDLNNIQISSSQEDNLNIIPIKTYIKDLPGYQAQNLTFGIMIGFLIVIAAVVIGIFIYVLTMQKRNVFGVLKAQGISNKVLSNSVLSQTFILAVIGVGIGLLATVGTSLGLPAAVPFQSNWAYYGGTAVLMILFAVIGAFFSVISINKIDPLEAINT